MREERAPRKEAHEITRPGTPASVAGVRAWCLLARGLVGFWRYKCANLRTTATWGRLGLGILRSLRVFGVLPTTLRLMDTEVYRRYGHLTLAQNLLHFVCSRHYLRRGLSMQVRARLALEHARFESSCFDGEYFERVYGNDGLTLWSHGDPVSGFRIVLKIGCRLAPEGDLRISLMQGQQTLHNICFTWTRWTANNKNIAPFIARNQSINPADVASLAAFQHEFPQNSAAFFCYAALQGLASAVGANEILAVRTEEQILFQQVRPLHFAGAYGGFWATLGGTDKGALGISIPLPFKLTPLEQIASKHRSRALKRRAHWRSIEEASRRALLARTKARHITIGNELEPAFEA